ncbi:MAG: hypothetical protein B6I24_06115 [Bacteroidetes bacterium 4572_128]|nr:MAG: hypothetical protein B6I24_06115 [Bacteroidetes bacterium 4572_128]
MNYFIKSKFITLVISLFVITFFSCTKEKERVIIKEVENVEGSGTVDFSVQTKEVEENLLKNANVLPEEVASIKIRIIDAVSEEVVYEKTKNVIIINDNLAIESIVLKVGSYKITDFILYNVSGEMLYLLPLENSEFAELVNDPAPICFDITEDNGTPITIEVIGTNCASCPIDKWGYTKIDVICPACICIQVGAFTFSESSNHFELTASDILVYGISDCCEDLLETFNLTNIFNKITFGGSGEYYAYKFVFQKDGYTDCEYTFTVQELDHFSEIEPLSVILDNCQMLNDLYLIAGFTFNEDFFGYGPNHYEASIVGTPEPQLINNTVTIFNTAGYLTFPSEILNELNDFSVKTTVSFQDHAANFILSTNNSYFEIWENSGNRIYVRLGTQEKYLTLPENFVLGQFYDILVTRSGGEITIYLDGSQLGILTYTFESALNINQIRSGRRIDNNHTFNGAIDDISFYNRVIAP